jgi:hypothetical protein
MLYYAGLYISGGMSLAGGGACSKGGVLFVANRRPRCRRMQTKHADLSQSESWMGAWKDVDLCLHNR